MSMSKQDRVGIALLNFSEKTIGFVAKATFVLAVIEKLSEKRF